MTTQDYIIAITSSVLFIGLVVLAMWPTCKGMNDDINQMQDLGTKLGTVDFIETDLGSTLVIREPSPVSAIQNDGIVSDATGENLR